MFKCSRCGREVPMAQIKNGYIGQCCNEVRFYPVLEAAMPAGVEEERDDEPDQ